MTNNASLENENLACTKALVLMRLLLCLRAGLNIGICAR
jgi:hypothetical protein